MPNLLELIKEQWAPGEAAQEQYRGWEQELGPNPEVMTGDPGGAPGMAMIPNPKNIEQFRELMNKWMKLAPKNWPEEMKQAWSFMRARHPNLMKKADVKYNPESTDTYAHIPKNMEKISRQLRATIEKLSLNVGKRTGFEGGGFVRGKTPLDYLPGGKEIMDARADPDDLKTMVESLTHELQHIIQGYRTPKMVNSKYKDYVPSPHKLDDFLSFIEYYTQPAERLARKASRRGAKELDEFLDMTGY